MIDMLNFDWSNYSYSKFIFILVNPRPKLPCAFSIERLSMPGWSEYASISSCKLKIMKPVANICNILQICDIYSKHFYLHIIAKNIYLIPLYRLGDNLLCLVIDGRKFPEFLFTTVYLMISNAWSKWKPCCVNRVTICLPMYQIHYSYPVIDCLNITCRTLIVLCMTLVGCWLCIARLYQ